MKRLKSSTKSINIIQSNGGVIMAEAVFGYIKGDFFNPLTEGSWERMHSLRNIMPKVGESMTDVLPIEVMDNQTFPIFLKDWDN